MTQATDKSEKTATVKRGREIRRRERRRLDGAVRRAWMLFAAALLLTAGTPAIAQTAARSVPLPASGAPMDPYLFVFLLLGGGILCLIAVVVTDNKLVSGYATDRKYTKDVIKDRTLIH